MTDASINVTTAAFTATISDVDEPITMYNSENLGTQDANENDNTFSRDISSSFTDPDGNAITYAITGGNDADVFMIDSDGVVAFKGAGPDITVDSDYVLNITATD